MQNITVLDAGLDRNLDRGQYRFQPIKFVSLVVLSPCETSHIIIDCKDHPEVITTKSLLFENYAKTPLMEKNCEDQNLLGQRRKKLRMLPA